METLPALSSKIQPEANMSYSGQTKMFLGFESAFITASTEQQQGLGFSSPILGYQKFAAFRLFLSQFPHKSHRYLRW